MRKLFSILCLILVTFGMLIQTVDAKRFGGGRSIGYQRSANNFSRPQAPQIPQQRPSSGASKWLGPLAGLAAGGLLASLFMGKGIGSGILTWVLLIGGGLILWSFIRNRLQPNAQFSPPAENIIRNNVAPFTSVQNPVNNSINNSVNNSAPLGFDSVTMVRDAKVLFIRLQAAYDTKNLNDLREFTTPEIFAETQMQFQERGDAINQTEVVTLEARLLDVTTEANFTIASVAFSGLIRENTNEPAMQLNETWHFKKFNNESKWLVAGIQQDN